MLLEIPPGEAESPKDFKRKPFGTAKAGYLQTGCPSHHQTNIVKALKRYPAMVTELFLTLSTS